MGLDEVEAQAFGFAAGFLHFVEPAVAEEGAARAEDVVEVVVEVAEAGPLVEANGVGGRPGVAVEFAGGGCEFH